ncbi:hypothetical protein J3459_011018 [Metarhizium acridum]|nr:hypothetical protein J3459_011018 [Metarhizium acridum]
MQANKATSSLQYKWDIPGLLLTPDTARPTGECRAETTRPNSTPIEMRETSLEGENREKFLAMIRKMLQWEPARRASAKELAEDEWIMQHNVARASFPTYVVICHTNKWQPSA